jgi:hypothetical protein
VCVLSSSTACVLCYCPTTVQMVTVNLAEQLSTMLVGAAVQLFQQASCLQEHEGVFAG